MDFSFGKLFFWRKLVRLDIDWQSWTTKNLWCCGFHCQLTLWLWLSRIWLFFCWWDSSSSPSRKNASIKWPSWILGSTREAELHKQQHPPLLWNCAPVGQWTLTNRMGVKAVGEVGATVKGVNHQELLSSVGEVPSTSRKGEVRIQCQNHQSIHDYWQ